MEEHHFNPFPGLRPFEEDEEHLFFGRENQIDQLSSKLSQNHFLAVIGASGSGKSSLVKSGLIPVLHSGLCSGVGHGWRIGVFRPGNNPIKNLTDCFFSEELLGNSPTSDQESLRPIVETSLRRSDYGLKNVHEQLLSNFEENILIVVDQFEELFRFSSSEKQSNSVKREADAFINLLLRATENKSKKLYIAITMRSDFLGDCTAFRGLPEAINKGQYLIPRMSREERKLAITGPVAVAGVKIAPRLVTKLLNDVGESPDHLPILQHSLMRTFNEWSNTSGSDHPLDLAQYEAIGTMSSALSLHAEEALAKLKESQLKICEGLFKALTEKGENARGVRRPTKLSSICSIIDEPIDKVIEVIEVFRDPKVSFLMPPFDVELNEDSIIDISHESLMRVWKRLINWVNEELESAEIYLRLSDAATFHLEGKSALWRDPELQLALNWKHQNQPNKNWAERYNLFYDQVISFLQQSLEQKEKAEQDQLKKEKASKRRTRLFLFFISIGFVFSSVFAYKSYLSKQKAESAEKKSLILKDKAEGAAREAKTASELAVKNERKANEQSLLAIKNEANAIKQKDIAEEQRIIANKNERKALFQKNIAQNEKRIADSAKELAEKQRLLAVENETKAISAERKANKLKNIEQAKRWIVLADKFVNIDPQFSAKLVLNAYDTLLNKGIGLQNTSLYNVLNRVVQKLRSENHFSKTLKNNSNFRTSIADGNIVYMSSGSGEFKTFDTQLKTSTVIDNFPNSFHSRVMAISKKTKILAFGNVNGELIFRNIEELNKAIKVNGKSRLRVHNGAIKDICFFDDSNLVTVGFDSCLREVNFFSGEINVLNESNRSSRLWSMTKSTNGLIVSNENNELLFYKNQNSKWIFSALDKLDIKKGIITTIEYIPSNEMLAIGTSEGEFLFYDPVQKAIVFRDRKTHLSLISSIDKLDNLILTSSHDKKVVVWNFLKPTVYNWQKSYSFHKQEVYNASFISPEEVISLGKKEMNVWTFSLEKIYNEIKGIMKNDVNFSDEQIEKHELFLKAE